MDMALVPGGLPATAAPLPEIILDKQNQAASPPVAAAPVGNGAAQAAPAQGSTPPPKPAYPPAAEPPTQEAAGLRFDFNSGCRVLLPETGKPWKVQISDLDTGNVLFQTELMEGRVNSSKRYYVRFRLEVWQDGQLVLNHHYDATDREVLIQFPVGTLGDTIGWFPYATKFQEKHKCRLTCGMAEKLIPLFRDAYPHITFLPHEDLKTERYYATYSMGLFFDDKEHLHQPCDFRYVGLHRTAGYILDVDPTETPPQLAIPDDSRPIPEPYVCIGVQSTTQAKHWNNPTGWFEIVRFLKAAGYRVICIDQKPVHGAGLVFNHIPNGAEDETGDRPLTERARWLKHADFFIGLSSGLSWLSWAAGTPVVLISGFTHPLNEFDTQYRVINYHTCNGCWNDPALRFDHHDFLWCPRHKDTPRQFECTRLITVDHVKATISRIPGFGQYVTKAAHVASNGSANASQDDLLNNKNSANKASVALSGVARRQMSIGAEVKVGSSANNANQTDASLALRQKQAKCTDASMEAIGGPFPTPALP